MDALDAHGAEVNFVLRAVASAASRRFESRSEAWLCHGIQQVGLGISELQRIGRADLSDQTLSTCASMHVRT